MSPAARNGSEPRRQEAHVESSYYKPAMMRKDSSREGDDDEKTQKPPICQIPTEIMLEILSYLDEKDLSALARTNRLLHSALNPILYANNVNLYHSSSMFWAARQGMLQTLKYAHAAGADLNLRGPILYQPTAAGAANQARVPIKDRITANGTPLHHAAQRGHGHVASWLIKNGAFIDAPSQGICNCGYGSERTYAPDEDHPEDPQWVPLHTALCHGKLSVAKLLIAHNALLVLKASRAPDSRYGQDHALHLAAARGFVSIIEFLHSLTYVEINLRDRRGYTALHHAAEHLNGGTHSRVIHATIDKLLSLGADINAINNEGESPLTTAVKARSYLVALKLLSLGADPNPHRDSDGCPLLFFCVFSTSSEPSYEWPNNISNGRWVKRSNRHVQSNTRSLIQALVNYGADVDAVWDSDSAWEYDGGMTALMIACRGGNLQAADELVRCGASINIEDSQGYTPLSLCFNGWIHEHRWARIDLACLLIRNGARLDFSSRFDTNPFPDAKELHRWWAEILRVSSKDTLSWTNLENLILRLHGDRSYFDNFNKIDELRTLLLDFAKKAYGLSKTNIQRYLDFSLQRDDIHLFKYLHNNGYIRFVANSTQLNQLEYLGDPSTVYTSLEALLAGSMLRSSGDMARSLVKYPGLSVQGPRFRQGQTLLHIAIDTRFGEVAERLLERGANADEFDYDLNTPMSLAVRNYDFSSTLITMLEHGANPHATPSDAFLEKIYPNNPDIRQCRKDNFMSAFDLAISHGNIHALRGIICVSKYPLPDIPTRANFSYVHLACQSADPSVLKWLIHNGADPNGGKGCLDPPAATILRKLWEKDDTDGYEGNYNYMKSLRLLLGIYDDATKQEDISVRREVFAMLVQICEYDGAEDYYVSLKRVIERELRIASVEGSLVLQNSDGTVVPIVAADAGDITFKPRPRDPDDWDCDWLYCLHD